MLSVPSTTLRSVQRCSTVAEMPEATVQIVPMLPSDVDLPKKRHEITPVADARKSSFADSALDVSTGDCAVENHRPLSRFLPAICALSAQLSHPLLSIHLRPSRPPRPRPGEPVRS